MQFEYKVVPAPRRGLKGKGVKGAEALFANALQTVMNELGAEGWDYVRADTLPMEERQGLTGKVTTWQNMLVFRRAKAGETVASAAAVPAPVSLPDTTVRRPVLRAVETPEPAEPAAEPAPPPLGPAPQR